MTENTEENILTGVVDRHYKRGPKKTVQEIVESESQDGSWENLLLESKEEDNGVGEDGEDPPDEDDGHQRHHHSLRHLVLLAVDIKVAIGSIVTSFLYFFNVKECVGDTFSIVHFLVGHIVGVKEAFAVVLLLSVFWVL